MLQLVKQVEPKALPKYNKHYIGLEIDGSPLNFVTFMPRKAHVIMTINGSHSGRRHNIGVQPSAGGEAMSRRG